MADDHVGQRVLEEEHVPAAPELVVGEERRQRRRPAGHRGGDDPAPALGREGRGAVGGDGAPVVADDHGVAVAAERLVQGGASAASAPVW